MPEITLGVVPSTTPGDRRAALDAVCDALTTIIGIRVVGSMPGSYGELASELEKDRIQYAWMSPTLMVLTGEQIKLQPLLSAVRGQATEYCSALFVDGGAARPAGSAAEGRSGLIDGGAARPAGSAAEGRSGLIDGGAARPAGSAAEGRSGLINALRDKTVAWVDRTSASGYLYPRIHLAARGVDPSALFRRELFLHSHDEVVRAVLDGRADVGATYAEQPPPGQPIRRAGFCDVAPEHPIRVLEWTQPIPNDLIAGHGLIPRAEHRVFGNAMLTLAERDDGRRLLFDAFHAERFVTTPNNALRPLLLLVSLARKHGLLNQL